VSVLLGPQGLQAVIATWPACRRHLANELRQRKQATPLN